MSTARLDSFPDSLDAPGGTAIIPEGIILLYQTWNQVITALNCRLSQHRPHEGREAQGRAGYCVADAALRQGRRTGLGEHPKRGALPGAPTHRNRRHEGCDSMDSGSPPVADAPAGRASARWNDPAGSANVVLGPGHSPPGGQRPGAVRLHPLAAAGPMAEQFRLCARPPSRAGRSSSGASASSTARRPAAASTWPASTSIRSGASNRSCRRPCGRPNGCRNSTPRTNPDVRLRLSRLLSAALEWIADYEQWALDALGLEYRRRCAAGWHKKVIPPEGVPAAWRRLAERYRSAHAEDRSTSS